MKFKGHGTVVADDIVLIRPAVDGRVFPMAGQFDVRLVEPPAVDVGVAVVKGNGFAGQRDDALHEHFARRGETFRARKADGHHVAAPRFVKQVGEAVDEIDAVVVIRRLHRNAVHADGQQHEMEGDEANGHQHRDAQQRGLGPPPDERHLQPARFGGGHVRVLHKWIKPETGPKLRANKCFPPAQGLPEENMPPLSAAKQNG